MIDKDLQYSKSFFMEVKIVSILSPKTIGIDLYDMPLKAVERNEGVFFDRKLEDVVFDIPILESYTKELIVLIRDKYYWGDFGVTNSFLQYVLKKVAGKILKPRLLLSIPSDILHGRFGSIFQRMIDEAGISAGSRQVQIIENVICAAIGGGIKIKQSNKISFIYSNEWCTYISVIFSNTLLDPIFIEKSYLEISVEELIEAYESLLLSLPSEAPIIYTQQKPDSNANNDIQRNWQIPIENKIYLAVPNIKRQEYGMGFGKYTFIYINNYEECIIRGLETLIQDQDIFKPHLY